VWLLTGHKAGDNSQVTALAEALGWPYATRHFNYQPYELLSNRLLGATLAGIDRPKSSALTPPWPDLVITAGRRNEPVARWIRKQAPACRLVHVGRPWSPLPAFDLIVTTPQYFLPDSHNVLCNSLPLHGVNTGRMAAAAEAWREPFMHLPRPWTALLVGGDSGPFVFTADKGHRLGQSVNALVKSSGGSLLVTDSARTPAGFFEALLRAVGVPAYIHRWQPGLSENPYLAYLALADQFVVTGESMSMLTEACYTGKPLYIFDPGEERAWWHYRHNYRFKPLSHQAAMRFAPRRMRRDVGNIQRQLIASGRAVWLGQAYPGGTRASCLPDDLERATARVRALFAA
jgi:mitochondrial fission protein ELM1